MNTQDKFNQLVNQLKQYDQIAVAFSGGIDSAFLLYISTHILGNPNTIAITIKSPFTPERDLNDAIEFSTHMNVQHHVVSSDFGASFLNVSERYSDNLKIDFSLIAKNALLNNFHTIATGHNSEDINERQIQESVIKDVKIISPLKDAGLTKKEIRNLAYEYNVSLWARVASTFDI